MSDIKNYKPLSTWCEEERYNYSTAAKRRAAAGVGASVNAKLWMLTASDWEKVKNTPLPGCKRIRHGSL